MHWNDAVNCSLHAQPHDPTIEKNRSIVDRPHCRVRLWDSAIQFDVPRSLTENIFDVDLFDEAASWRLQSRGLVVECGYHVLLTLAERRTRLLRLTGRYQQARALPLR
jgi:hypothetical protein